MIMMKKNSPKIMYLNQNKTVKAFTINELLVVIIITSIVFYIVFLIVNTNFIGLDKIEALQAHKESQILLKTQINQLVFNADRINSKNQKIIFQGENDLILDIKDSTVLLINSDGILLDEFPVVVDQINTYKNLGLISSIEVMVTQNKNQKVTWHFQKDYDYRTMYEEHLH